MFDEAQIGDEVWSFTYGPGTVISVEGLVYPIQVMFDSIGSTKEYSLEGKFDEASQRPDLYWAELEFDIPSNPERTTTNWMWVIKEEKGKYFISKYLEKEQDYTGKGETLLRIDDSEIMM